ncbi:nascent polypeptide-associated complex subunit alpha, muscle-specific form-like, partial [Penaeus chinensis]|uniref:nascent polypeptide-associated complex subunit alpha, muscle-specific form-like n=1 Tax=Penaeus chinensis TaxID=139456 RepID=UPI001FB634C3
ALVAGAPPPYSEDVVSGGATAGPPKPEGARTSCPPTHGGAQLAATGPHDAAQRRRDAAARLRTPFSRRSEGRRAEWRGAQRGRRLRPRAALRLLSTKFPSGESSRAGGPTTRARPLLRPWSPQLPVGPAAGAAPPAIFTGDARPPRQGPAAPERAPPPAPLPPGGAWSPEGMPLHPALLDPPPFPRTTAPRRSPSSRASRTPSRGPQEGGGGGATVGASSKGTRFCAAAARRWRTTGRCAAPAPRRPPLAAARSGQGRPWASQPEIADAQNPAPTAQCDVGRRRPFSTLAAHQGAGPPHEPSSQNPPTKEKAPHAPTPCWPRAAVAAHATGARGDRNTDRGESEIMVQPGKRCDGGPRHQTDPPTARTATKQQQHQQQTRLPLSARK